MTGAGTGIGAAIVDALEPTGALFCLVGRRETPLLESAKRAGGAERTIVFTGDLARPEQAAAVVDVARLRWGRIDVLINNAGRADMRPLAETDDELARAQLAINFDAPLRLIRRLWPIFCEQSSGTVINISSMAVVDPFPGLGVYAAAKAALDSLTRSIRNEGDEHGIRAWSIAPGAVETAMLRGLLSTVDLPESATLQPSAVAQVVADVIAGRRPEPSGSTILVPSQ